MPDLLQRLLQRLDWRVLCGILSAQYGGVRRSQGAVDMKKLYIAAVCMALVCAHGHAQAGESSISVSPITLLSVIAAPNSDTPLECIWFAGDWNFFRDDNKETSFGIFLEPFTYGLRFQQRKYTNDGHAGFLIGWFTKIEYRKMGWHYTEAGDINISYDVIANRVTGTPFHSVGATIGFNTGFRIRGSSWGGTFYVGAGIPIFYCFGSKLPPEDELMSFYGLNVMLRAFELGLKFDFYR
jgi:hypothetical protein